MAVSRGRAASWTGLASCHYRVSHLPQPQVAPPVHVSPQVAAGRGAHQVDPAQTDTALGESPVRGPHSQYVKRDPPGVRQVVLLDALGPLLQLRGAVGAQVVEQVALKAGGGLSCRRGAAFRELGVEGAQPQPGGGSGGKAIQEARSDRGSPTT